jgi:hypothetical protein
MNAAVPRFFLSYARHDDDDYLKRFFTDLRQAVSRLDTNAAYAPGFRDDEGVATGEDWNSTISAAVHSSNALVCVYTPRFFHREFCAKEFAVFIRRNRNAQYKLQPDAEGNQKYQICDVRNIFPVLWISERDLTSPRSNAKPLPPTWCDEFNTHSTVWNRESQETTLFKVSDVCR